MSLLVIGSHYVSAGTVSFDQLQVSGDLTVEKWNADMNTMFIEFNSNIESSNIADNTLTESEQADDINPRIRTFEGAACEKVDDGLLPATDSDLTSDISLGTAYPRGFRCDKSSATAKTYSTSIWTYVDIDQNCDFQFTEVAIDASAPSIATNSIRLARVSTDSSIIVEVQDLRTLSCSGGPFHLISDTTNESTLANIFTEGQPVRRFSPAGRTPEGFARGLFVSFGNHTQFLVTSGVAIINGLYRHTSSDITVGTTNDNPGQGTSGLDTGSIAANTTYFVYVVADEDDVATLSATYSTNASTPTGTTNHRLIGQIKTDADTLFKSRDLITVHAINETETPGSWISFGCNATLITSADSLNVSGLTNDETGQCTVTWDTDYNSAFYACVTGTGGADSISARAVIESQTAGAIVLNATNTSNTKVADGTIYNVVCFGDLRR
ncbi:MAG: hypothetical protein IH948_09260 [Bacteroidetes bacterium]|nr:hypothetical protein [Bacteroidota bacterium]